MQLNLSNKIKLEVMKSIQRLLLGAIFVALSANLYAAPKKAVVEFKPGTEDIRIVQAEVRKLLENKNFDLKGIVDVTVVLYLNDDNEMMILNVGSKDQKLRQFLMKNLNRKKFADDQDRRGYTYICPMRLRGVS